jgi:hypothetical protein
MKKMTLILVLVLIAACGRRGDPVAISPYREIGVVKDLKAIVKKGKIYLTWGMPAGKDFPEEALKGFVVFRAEVPEGVTVEECECYYRALDFIVPDDKKSFEYLDKKAIEGRRYIFKLLVMDINNRMGEDSNIVLVKTIKPEPEEIVITIPEAPTGFVAVYTQESIVLTWDEVRGQEINFYRVYRSEGNGFDVIGETVTPVFNDENIEPSKKYYYRVTAVGKTEGPPSEEVEIITKLR